jgi:NhaP-type Na+/H+ or K+/H+ antiporter
MQFIEYLPILSIMLFLGFFIRLISKKFRLPWMILLILLGFAMKNFSIGGQHFMIPSQALIIFTLFILIIVVFNDISTISMHEFNEYSGYGIKLTAISFVSNMLFLTFFSYFFLGINSFMLNILLALIVSSTDLTTIIFMFKENKATEIMKYEALMNTPVALIGSLAIIGIMQANLGITTDLMNFFPLIKQILLGIGAGVFFSIITFDLMSKFHHKHLSPALLILLAVASYLFAEFIKGMGIFAIAVYALAFEKSLLEKKTELRNFSRKFSDFFSVLAFMLLGYLLPSGLSTSFILSTFFFFAVYLALRIGSVWLALHGELKFKELFFISMTPAKGLTVAVLAILSSEFNFLPREVTNAIILFLLFSIMLSSLMAILSHRMFRKDIED